MFVRKLYNMKKKLHICFWTLVLFQGVFQLCGIPNFVYNKLGISLVLFFLFTYTLLSARNQIIYLPGIYLFLLFALMSALSLIFNGTSLVLCLFFLQSTMIGYIYFLVIFNENDLSLINSVCRYIKYVFGVQIIAILIKFFIIGISESGSIGTMSLTSGSLSAIFPLFVISVIMPFWLYGKTSTISFIVLATGFWVFGIIGDKRALLWMYPMFIAILLLFFLLQERTRWAKVIRNFAIIGLMGVFSFYFAARLLPTMNPEREVWGSFDIEHIFGASQNYALEQNRDRDQEGRLSAWQYLPMHLQSKGDLSFLLGDGPGILIATSFRNSNLSDLSESELFEQLYDLSYGVRVGFLWIMAQVGFLGVVSYIFFIMSIIRKALKNDNKIMSLIIKGVICVVVFDFFLYSYTYVAEMQINALVFLILGITMKKYHLDIFNNRTKVVVKNDG